MVVIANVATGAQRFLTGFSDDVVCLAVSSDRRRLVAGR